MPAMLSVTLAHHELQTVPCICEMRSLICGPPPPKVLTPSTAARGNKTHPLWQLGVDHASQEQSLRCSYKVTVTWYSIDRCTLCSETEWRTERARRSLRFCLRFSSSRAHEGVASGLHFAFFGHFLVIALGLPRKLELTPGCVAEIANTGRSCNALLEPCS